MRTRRWRPTKAQMKEYISKMNEIDEFCKVHNIERSASSDSYYFTLNGQDYRISNHTIEASNKRAYDGSGRQKRHKYHPDEREDNIKYIHASKTRLIEIYKILETGCEVDGYGMPIIKEPESETNKTKKCKKSINNIER